MIQVLGEVSEVRTTTFANKMERQQKLKKGMRQRKWKKAS